MTFEDVIRRQLDLFESALADRSAVCVAGARATAAAGRDEAEERYGDYVDLVETGTEELAALRDHFASTMTAEAAIVYQAEFNRAVLVRLPRFALEIEEL